METGIKKLKLEEAYELLKKKENIPFSQLFSKSQIATILKNKGRTGQLLELALGMELSSDTSDFIDGELKTNKCDRFGNPKETVFITQIASYIDEMLIDLPFRETNLYEKIRNILYVPVMKEGNPEEWMFLPCIHIDLEADGKFRDIQKQLEDDYYNICQQLENHIITSEDGYIHTSNGKYIQIRCKDTKDITGSYHPIYSEIYDRYISNKNHAFYFKKEFIKKVREYLQEE